MKGRARIAHIVIGPALYALSVGLLSAPLTREAAEAVGLLAWMVYWWVTRPVHMTVTAFLPMVMNAVFAYTDQATVVAQYFSESILLIFGTFLLTIPWEKTGFDRRIALKILSIVGPSITSQIVVWMTASILLSTVLPNLAVCALFSPIAVAMLKAAGYDDIPSCKQAVPILLVIGWGAGIGGVGTPIGGAMNVTAITILQEHLGIEVMYVDWVVRLLPYLLVVSVCCIAATILMHRGLAPIEGTKTYFADEYAKLGTISRDEVVSGALFGLGLAACFARPLYSTAFPSLAPAYVMVGLGLVTFFITCADGKPLQTWEITQRKTMWGMMLLFGGGLALGKVISASGASEVIANLALGMHLDGGFTTVLFFAVLAIFLSEVTSSTVSAAICVPILLALTDSLGVDPIPYWFSLIMAYNGQFLLPISVLAVPCSYGIDPAQMLRRGGVLLTVKLVCAVAVGWLCMQLWPGFGVL